MGAWLFSHSMLVTTRHLWFSKNLKLVSAIFQEVFIFHQMVALQKLWKMFFTSSKKLFSFSRYSNFCISTFPSSSPCQPLLESLIQHNLKVYDVINCLNKNLITHFVWYLEEKKRYDKKVNFIFSFQPIPFLWTKLLKTKGAWN